MWELAQRKRQRLYLERIEQVLKVRHLPENKDAYKVATTAGKKPGTIKRELGTFQIGEMGVEAS